MRFALLLGMAAETEDPGSAFFEHVSEGFAAEGGFLTDDVDGGFSRRVGADGRRSSFVFSRLCSGQARNPSEG